MIFSYSTNAFVKVSLTEALEMISGIGFTGVEIMCDRPHLYPPDADEDALVGLKRTLRNLGLTITNLNCFTLFAVGDTYLPSWIEPDPAKRKIRIDHTLNCLKIAHFLGCSCISVPPGGPPSGDDETASRSLFYKGLEQVIPLAEELGVSILIEPEPGLLIENSAQINSFVADIASDHLGINFDVGHFFCVGEKPEAAFEILFDRVGHIHIEDIARSRVHNHLIPGLGAIDFDAFVKTMAHLGYGGGLCLELYPYVDTPEEAGIQSRNHLMPVLEKYGY